MISLAFRANPTTRMCRRSDSITATAPREFSEEREATIPTVRPTPPQQQHSTTPNEQYQDG